MKRYDLEQYEGDWANMAECADGDYVEYTDIVEIIQQARQEIAREILNDRLIIAYIAPDGLVHKQLMKKYGLEG